MSNYDSTRYVHTVRTYTQPTYEQLEMLLYLANVPLSRVTVETWEVREQTHGTVEEEMMQNGYFQCDCGKMHGKYTGKVCDRCGATFPFQYAQENCRT